MKKLSMGMELVSDSEVTAPLSGKKGSAFAVPDIWRDNHRIADPERAIPGVARPPSSRKHIGQKVEVRKRTDRMERGSKQDARVLFLSDDSDDDELVVSRSRGRRLQI